MKWFYMIWNWIRSLFCAAEMEDPDEEPVTEPENPSDTGDTQTVTTPEPEPNNEPEPEPDNNDNSDNQPIPMAKIYNKVILLDNGHASSTPGKRSPVLEDGRQFFEYEFNRDVVRRIADKLSALGIKYEILVPEVEKDVYLTERANRANKFVEKYGINNCLFLSIHSNAAGHGDKWMTAKGWCCYTSKGETKSDEYAEIFMREAEKVLVPEGLTIRKYSSKKYSWEDNFTVLVKTKCHAVLTESLFYDNKEEVKYLLSDAGRDKIAELHVNAILQIENLSE